MRDHTLRLLLIAISFVALTTQDSEAQCIYSLIDTFDDELIFDVGSLDPAVCAELPYELESVNWHNISSLDDESDWLPHQGSTPTNFTGPYSTNYVLPFAELTIVGTPSLEPIFPGPFDTPLTAPNDCTMVPIPTPSPSSPYVITESMVDVLFPYFPVWPGPGGDLGSPYLYVEGTGCCGGTAILESDSISLDVYENVQLAFRYHMYGSDMGSLAMETSLDSGATWVQQWQQSGAAGLFWQQETVDLTAVFNGVQNGLIRFVAALGPGERSDIAIDDISLLAAPEPIVVVEDSTLTFDQLADNCWIQVEFDKPSDSGLPCHPEPEVAKAELLLNLSLGDNYRYGGTSLGEGVDLKVEVNALDAAGQPVPACSSTDTVLIQITDDRHPEQLYIHDFKDCYADVDHFNIIVLSLDTLDAEYPAFVDDLEFRITVDVEEDFTAHGLTTTLNDPVVPSGTLAQVHFSWEADCDFPLYRFQLLRLHKTGPGSSPCGGADGPFIKAHMNGFIWELNALTLEVPEKELDLTMMEGTGYYAWRVMPIGNVHPGREANDLNYGNYSSFSSISLLAIAPEDVGGGCEAGIFWYDDPNDALLQSKNRTMSRAFSRNLGEQEELLVKESVTYVTEDGFESQTQTHMRSQEVTLAHQKVRDFSGRDRLSVLPVPIADGAKGNLDHEGQLIQFGGGLYTAAHFDDDENFKEPDGMEGPISEYYSDANPDLSIPNAANYPFTATVYTRDGTNRPTAVGAEGPVKRLRDDIDSRITEILYSSVGEEELLRVFGHEAPDVQSVEKVMTIDPEHVTRIAYVDEQGRTIATCLSSNSSMDTVKIVSLAPDEGFSNATPLEGTQVNDFKWEVFHEFSLTEETNVELNYSLDQPRFQALCEEYCAACDYRVRFKLIETDELDILLEDSLIITGEQLPSCAPASPETWSHSTGLGKGRYQFVQTVEYNTEVGGQLYLDVHKETVLEEVEQRIEAVTGPLMTYLDSVANGEQDWLTGFYDYCADNSDSNYVDEDEVLWYWFDVGEDCDAIVVPVEDCPFDCDPATRDFEAFFNGVVADAFITYAESTTLATIATKEDGGAHWGRTIANGGELTTGGYAFFPDWVSTDEPGDIRNIAADTYDVPDGEFNQLIENLISDGADSPECYPGYTCYNIHYKLEAIAEEHIYTFKDTSVVNRLMDELGYHFKDTRGHLSDGETSSGELVDGTALESIQGWKSHPHKFVHVPLLVSDCAAPGSIYDLAQAAVGLDDLDYSIEEHREDIEQTYLVLHNCYYGEEEGDISESLTGDQGDEDYEETEFGADGVNAENLLETWQEDCEEAIAAKESVYIGVAEDFIDPDNEYAASGWPSAALFQRDCIVAQLVKHAEELCYLPHDRLDTLGVSVGPSGLVDDEYFKVIDHGSGEFVRYGMAEYGPHAANEELYCNDMIWGSSYDLVKALPTVREYGFGLIPQWTDSDVEAIAAITYGAVEICTGDCDTSEFDLLPLNVSFAGVGDTIFAEDFESWGAVDFCKPLAFEDEFGPYPVPINSNNVLANWLEMHDGAGYPVLTEVSFCDDHEVVLSSLPDTITPVVLGNGIRYEDYIEFTPGMDYEIQMTLRYEEGNSMDHFFAAIAPGVWYPECGSPPYETFYPPSYTNVLANWNNHVGWAAPSHTYQLRETFTWQPLSNDPASVAPNQGLEQFPYYPNKGFLHLYPKQYLQSDSLKVSIDDIYIIEKPQRICDSLYVRYTILTPEPDTTEIETCEQQLALQLIDRISAQEEAILERHEQEVEHNYISSCVPVDQMTIANPLNYYQYTLYYYDAAGRLVRTVPPKGVDADDNHTRQSIPDHTHVTEYAYNGLGNLVRKETPDGSVVNTWYDRLERVRFTQTAQDADDEVFRYICYDLQSRPIRSGVKALGSDVLDDHVDDVDWPVDDPSDPSDCADCYERIVSVYGDPVGSWFEQTHLVDRLSFMTNDMGDTIAYSYNATGQIEKLYQYVNGLGASLCEYEFDASSGLIQEIVLNRGRADEFHMRHLYDEDQRVTETFSSRDGRVWSRDGAAEYYGHGLLKRQELGHYGVQGQDFVYNIHQKLIGINAPSLEGEDDPGADGESGTHAWVSPDVFGLHLAHYRGEFGRDGSPFNASNASHDEAQDLFHDHIASTSFQQRKDFEDGLAQVGHRLQYDEEERVRGSTLRTFSSTWANDAGGRYSASFDYDPNGNLLSLTRAGSADAGTIDDVEYEYVEGKNWLDHIIDSEGNVTGSDLASQSEGNFQYDFDGRLSSDAAEGLGLIEWRADGKVKRVEKSDSDTVITFRYNPLGHRIAKITESAASGTQDTTWYIPSREGKIMAVYRTHGVGPPALAFNRTEGGTATSDPSGSAPLFGKVAVSSDFYTRHVGGDRIEIKDHLGNVRTVVSDLELALDADGDGALDGLRAEILKASDYHAYGSLMDGRGFDSIPYRFGFQGKEGDPELKGEGNSYDFQARFYDPRLGRWLSTDPMESDYPHLSPYNAMGADPINNTDPSGEIIETLWDVANVGMGVVSLAGNVAAGNYAGAAVDAAGVVADVAAVVVPGVPGGAGTAIKAARAGAVVAKHGPEAAKVAREVIEQVPVRRVVDVAVTESGRLEKLADGAKAASNTGASISQSRKVGKYGEELVSAELKRAFPKEEGYEVIEQLYMKAPKEDGGSFRTYADHLVRKDGDNILLVETKTGQARLSKGQTESMTGNSTFTASGRVAREAGVSGMQVAPTVPRLTVRIDAPSAARNMD